MNEKKGLIITLVVLAAILVAGGAGIYYLQFVVLEEKMAELAAVQQQVQAATAKKEKIPGLKKQIVDLEKDEVAKSAKIPLLGREEYDVFANLLDDVRKRAGVAVSRGAWQTAAGSARSNTPASMHRVVYELNVSGGFYQLLRYINLLEQKTRHIEVSSIAVQRGSSESRGKGVSPRDLRIQLTSYTYRQPASDILPKIVEEQVGQSTDFPQ